jgi:hypothetical protein
MKTVVFPKTVQVVLALYATGLALLAINDLWGPLINRSDQQAAFGAVRTRARVIRAAGRGWCRRSPAESTS